MKLLFDENLPPRLAAAFQTDYPGSTHVQLVGLGNASTAEIEAALRDKHEAIERLDLDADLAVLIV